MITNKMVKYKRTLFFKSPKSLDVLYYILKHEKENKKNYLSEIRRGCKITDNNIIHHLVKIKLLETYENINSNHKTKKYLKLTMVGKDITELFLNIENKLK